MPKPSHVVHRFRCPSMSQLHLGPDPGGRHVQPAPCSRRERAEPNYPGAFVRPSLGIVRRNDRNEEYHDEG